MQVIKVSIPGREEMQLSLKVENDQILSAQLTGVGGPTFLQTLVEWRGHIKGHIGSLPLPEGNSIAELMLRELILKAQGKWDFPYKDDELCHCRMVPTAVVDAAIICGAHDPKTVSRQTNASTQCGTCRPDVESIIRYRLQKR